MFLLTIPVLLFQLLIFVTLFIAAKMGKSWLIAATVAWTAFTLFGSIYTMGLLLLQLITIYFSYTFAKKRLTKTITTLE